MKLALLSDIHSNHYAFKACIDKIDTLDIDGIIFLGDYVSDCPCPQITMELIKEVSRNYQTWFVKGNREEYLVSHHDSVNDDGWIFSSNTGSLLYTYENLSENDIEFFRTLPVCISIEINGYPTIIACHGSPLSSREALFPAQENTDRYLKEMESCFIVIGHTHNQYCYHAYGKTLINGGSVGAPTNGQTKAQFAVLESKGSEWVHKFISVEYDIQKMVEEFEESKFNEKALIWAKCMLKHLQTGIDFNLKCLMLADELAQKQEPLYDTSQIPEIYWTQAARDLGILDSILI